MISFFLLLIVSGTGEDHPPFLPCSNNADIAPSIRHATKSYDKINGRWLYKSSLDIDNLQNGATVCFDLTTPESKTLKLAVQFEEASGSVNFEDQYDFGIPNVTAKCTCSCSDSSGVFTECDANDMGFCNGYSGLNGRCVTKKRKEENNDECVKVASSDSNLCCAIRMRQEDIKNRYKAFQVRSAKQVTFKLKLYQSYTDKTMEPYVVDDLKGQAIAISSEDVIFETVTATTETVNTGFLKESEWYIGKSDPYNATVYETTEQVNPRNVYDISRIGWLKYDDFKSKYKMDEDALPDSKIEEAFKATVKACAASDITSSFDAIRQDDFEESLTSLQQKYSTNLDEMTWVHKGTENHGTIKWKYKRSTVKVDFKLIFPGNSEDFHLEKIEITSFVGEFDARVVLSQHGEAYIEINLKSSFGNIYGDYTIGSKDELQFSFEITNETSQTYHHRDTGLECVLNAVGKLCLSAGAGATKKCKSITCTEEKIDDPDTNDHDIDTETVVSDDPLNWKTWAKFANPLEWFNGIDSYQEGIMLAIELMGLFGGTFLVIKILRTLNLLGKCCRFMFCCFLCPKTEKKVRNRAETFYDNTRRRMTSTRRRMTAASQGLRRSVRGRINTTVAIKYLQSKMDDNKRDTKGVETGDVCYKNPAFENTEEILSEQITSTTQQITPAAEKSEHEEGDEQLQRGKRKVTKVVSFKSRSLERVING